MQPTKAASRDVVTLARAKFQGRRLVSARDRICLAARQRLIFRGPSIWVRLKNGGGKVPQATKIWCFLLIVCLKIQEDDDNLCGPFQRPASLCPAAAFWPPPPAPPKEGLAAPS